MKTAFKLDAHPRRPRPLLSEPPAGYFNALPMQIMARLPQADARTAGRAWGWLGLLPPALRTGLASVAVLGSFAASFCLSGPAPRMPASATVAALNDVPRTELANYLLTSGVRIETTDLSVLTAAQPGITRAFLAAFDDELTDALDAQPADDAIYL